MRQGVERFIRFCVQHVSFVQVEQIMNVCLLYLLCPSAVDDTVFAYCIIKSGLTVHVDWREHWKMMRSAVPQGLTRMTACF